MSSRYQLIDDFSLIREVAQPEVRHQRRYDVSDHDFFFNSTPRLLLGLYGLMMALQQFVDGCHSVSPYESEPG